MKAKTWCWIGVILFFVVALAVFLTDNDPSVLIAAAGGYTGILSAWLGFDIAKTRDRTLSRAAGDWEPLKIARYLFALGAVGALLIITILRDVGSFSPVKVVLLPCFFGMGAMLIGGYGAVKVATPKGGQ